MTKEEISLRCEMAYEQLSKIHLSLCNEKKFDETGKIFEIMRQIAVFSQIFDKEE